MSGNMDYDDWRKRNNEACRKHRERSRELLNDRGWVMRHPKLGARQCFEAWAFLEGTRLPLDAETRSALRKHLKVVRSNASRKYTEMLRELDRQEPKPPRTHGQVIPREKHRIDARGHQPRESG